MMHVEYVGGTGGTRVFRYIHHNTMSILVVSYDYISIQIDIYIDISKATALSSPGGGRKYFYFFQ